MSLIERALDKVRNANAAEPRPAAPAGPPRPPLTAPEPRVAVEPQLHLTAEIRARLGLQPATATIRHQVASEFRHIKHQMMEQLKANPTGRVLMVASALAGEGKSFTSANLARALAMEPDYTVLLVDADVVKPQLSRAMGIVERPGLLNAVADHAVDVDSLVLATDIPGLSVLPAGSASENATEYFSSQRMRQVLEQLQAVPNRIVLIDTLPLLLTTEARVLMTLASQVLLVVRAETTPRNAVEQALALISEEVDVKLVLNAVDRTRITRYLGYGYGYQYDYSSGG
jgi:exopolysaccharide/PEP-CTERM locus tyrosine autokinase